jgi:hypothetical protein
MDDDRSMRAVKGSLGRSLGESEGEGHAATPVFPFQTTEAIVRVVDGGERLQCFRLSENLIDSLSETRTKLAGL